MPLKTDKTLHVPTLNIWGTCACLSIELNKIHNSSTILSPQEIIRSFVKISGHGAFSLDSHLIWCWISSRDIEIFGSNVELKFLKVIHKLVNLHLKCLVEFSQVLY